MRAFRELIVGALTRIRLQLCCLSKDTSSILPLALILGIGLFTLLPLTITGFTTNDDITQQLYALDKSVRLSDIVRSFAQSQGRFYFLFSGYLIFTPYLIDQWWFIKGISILAIAINIWLLGLFGVRLLNQRWFGYLTAMLFLITLQNTWDHNLLNAYPLVFTFGVSCLLMSLTLYSRATVINKHTSGWISAVLYFLSLLTYETFLLYAPLYFIFGYWKNPGTGFIRLGNTLKKTMPIVLVTVMYLGVYFFYGTRHPTGYDGNQGFGGTVGGFTHTLYQFGISASPLYSYVIPRYRPLLNDFGYTIDGDQRQPLFILGHLQLPWAIKASLGIGLLAWIFGFSQPYQVRSTRLLGLAGLSLVYVFLPGFIHALTPKYQSWVIYHGANSFTTTYFSSLAMALFLGSAGLLLGGWCHQLRLGKGYAVVMGVVVAMISVITDYQNYHVTISQQQSTLRWDAVKALAGTPEFQDIPERSYVYAPSLWNGIQHAYYWQDFIKVTRGKQLSISVDPTAVISALRDTNRQDGKAYYIFYNQEKKDIQQYLVLSPITAISTISGQLSIHTNRSLVMTRGKYKEYYLLIPLVDNKDTKTVYVDEVPYTTNRDYILAHINKQWPGETWTRTTLRGDAFLPNEMVMSHYADTIIPANPNPDTYRLMPVK